MEVAQKNEIILRTAERIFHLLEGIVQEITGDITAYKSGQTHEAMKDFHKVVLRLEEIRGSIKHSHMKKKLPLLADDFDQNEISIVHIEHAIKRILGDQDHALEMLYVLVKSSEDLRIELQKSEKDLQRLID